METITPTMIAACGLDCGQCPGYLAWRNDDQELRIKTVAEWKEVHGFEGGPEQVNCVGCLSAQEGPRIGYCSVCEIRNCAVEKAVETCAECEAYSCGTLAKFHVGVPEAKERLEKRR